MYNQGKGEARGIKRRLPRPLAEEPGGAPRRGQEALAPYPGSGVGRSVGYVYWLLVKYVHPDQMNIVVFFWYLV